MAKPRMTYEQARATTPDLTAWVGASAGTGKTHVLTARVLRLMLTGTRPENIVCLTFTKAAAAEMTNRIFEELGRWALMPDEELSAEINRRTEEYADEEMLVRARQLFAEVLDLSPGLQIQTFHSFCQSLLGRFPLEAGMAPGFEGVDEAEARDLMAGAKDQMLAATRKPRNKDLQDALSDVAKLVTENTFDEVIDRLSFEAATLSRAEAEYGGIDGLIAALYRALEVTPGDSPSRVVKSALDNQVFDTNGIHRLGTAMLEGSAAEAKKGDVLCAFINADTAKREQLFNEYKLVFLTAKDEARARVANKKTVESDPGLLDVIEKEQRRLIHIAETMLRLKAAAATASLLKLGSSQLARYHFLKSERGLVDFDDMIQKTVGLFRRADIAPWVLFKLDAEVEHILVDEAQDTNRDQWRVVEALAAEFFAGEGTTDKVRTLFAVGDAKQSIFSFQRADPKEFIAARDRVFHQAYEAGMYADNVPLNLSFRSGEAVLSLVDKVFEREHRASIGLSPDDEDVKHDFIRKGHGGLVEMWPLEAPQSTAKEDTPEWALPLTQESVDDAEERTAWRIARRVKAMITSGELLESHGRPIRAGDVLVLVRRRTGFVDHLVKAFKSLRIPVAGRDRMVLTEELAVMDLLVLARFVLQPRDDLSLATVLKGPFVGLDDEALFELAYGRKASLWNALLAKAKEPKFARAATLLTKLLNAVDLKTPFEFFSYLLTDLDGRKMLVSRLGEDIHDPVDELLEEALRFELTSAASMQAFVKAVDDSGMQIKRDLEAAGDNVRIMTAHSAKGLQAPIVFLSDLVGLPDVTRDTRLLPLESATDGSPIPFWTSPAKGLPLVDGMKADVKHRQLAEYRRLLYVALTRAEDRLYIAGWQGRDEPSDDCWAVAIEEGFQRLGAEKVKAGDIDVLRYDVPQTLEVIATEDKTETTEEQAAPDWLFDTMPDEPVPPKPLAPSKPEEEPSVSSPLVRTDEKRFQRGRYIHALLQWLPDLPAVDREEAALRYLKRTASELNDAQHEQLWQEVNHILTDENFRALFAEGSKAEVPIAGIVAGRAISGQVDRLVVTENEVLVVDYKTNRPPPVRVEDVQQVYVRQMALYAKALEGIYRDKKVKAALLWTDAARLMQVPDPMLIAALDRG